MWVSVRSRFCLCFPDPVIALRLQSTALVGRLAELGSLGTLATMQNVPDFIRGVAKQIREAHSLIPGPEFLAEYGKLVDRLFPGGYAKVFEQIQVGDGSAIEFGLVFIEVQPYYFRSQYHRTALIRMLKHARLSSLQAERLKRVLDVEHDKKMKRKTYT